MGNDLKYWLALNKIEGMGPISIKKLYEHFGSAEKIWNASEKELLSIEGLKKNTVSSLLAARPLTDLEKEISKIEKYKVKTLTLEDGDYPSALRNIYDPPPVLYVKGKLEKFSEKALAIVGTRKASSYGLELARQLGRELASLGITIVSGMASGIDTEAHKGAIEAKGKTVAVFGCGVDVIYPPENIGLAKEIENSGALVSEFPLGEGTSKGSFPRRNRIISGLSLGTIVVEGHYDSGAMITAKCALDQGREVFAVPGRVGLEQSKGPHWLIKQGAKLIESIDDVLDELTHVVSIKSVRSALSVPERDYSQLSEKERKVVESLSREPKHIDEIMSSSGFDIPSLAPILLNLEIKNQIKQLPGKYYIVV